MATISAATVKELRDKTGAGMMDCKKALVASDGDMEKALENLRKAGIAKAAKKSGRETKEGRVTTLVDGNVAVIAEVACETDFVAKNEKFQAYLGELTQRVAADYDGQDGDLTEEVVAAEAQTLTALIATIGENMQIRRVARWQTDAMLATYIHMGGRIGVLVEGAGEGDGELLRDVCMHVAAFRPQYVQPDDIPAEVLEKEKEIAEAQVAGKPANIIDKIVMGKINKWYTEVCLAKQPWLRDDKSKLEKVAPGLTIKRFARWEMGEAL